MAVPQRQREGGNAAKGSRILAIPAFCIVDNTTTK